MAGDLVANVHYSPNCGAEGTEVGPDRVKRRHPGIAWESLLHPWKRTSRIFEYTSWLEDLNPSAHRRQCAGDAFFDYVGAYSSSNGRWKGELINHEHTPTRGERPLLGGRDEVGIGFSAPDELLLELAERIGSPIKGALAEDVRSFN